MKSFQQLGGSLELELVALIDCDMGIRKWNERLSHGFTSALVPRDGKPWPQARWRLESLD